MADQVTLRELLERHLKDPQNKETNTLILRTMETVLSNGFSRMSRIFMGYYFAGASARALGDEFRASKYFAFAIENGQAGREVFLYFSEKMKDFEPGRAKRLFSMAENSFSEKEHFSRRLQEQHQKKQK